MTHPAIVSPEKKVFLYRWKNLPASRVSVGLGEMLLGNVGVPLHPTALYVAMLMLMYCDAHTTVGSMSGHRT
jgi:hypothetical protein